MNLINNNEIILKLYVCLIYILQIFFECSILGYFSGPLGKF